MKLIHLKYWGKKWKRQRLCTDKNLDFLEGFCVPYTWGQFVHTSEMNTSYNASSCSNNVEPWSRCCNDVTVRFFLGQLNCLLLLKNQEAVELCCSLLSVRVSTQLKQTDRFSSSFSESSLKTMKHLLSPFVPPSFFLILITPWSIFILNENNAQTKTKQTDKTAIKWSISLSPESSKLCILTNANI